MYVLDSFGPAIQYPKYPPLLASCFFHFHSLILVSLTTEQKVICFNKLVDLRDEAMERCSNQPWHALTAYLSENIKGYELLLLA